MISRRLFPHFSFNVKAFQFINIPNPVKVTTYLDLIPYSSSSLVLWVDGVSGHPQVDYSDMNETTGVLTVRISKSKINVNWNSIVARADNSETQSSYLSISYWDTVVSVNENFVTLELKYLSSYTVEADSGSVSLETLYINHEIDEGQAPSSSSAQLWKTHTNLYRNISNSIYGKTVWIGSSGPQFSRFTANSKADTSISGYAGVNDIPANANTIGVYSQDFRCIPSGVTTENSKLVVSPRFGVEFYNKSGVTVTQNGQVSAPVSNFSYPYEVYRFGMNVFLFYIPSRYELYVSCISGYKADNTPIWQTPWKVGGEGSLSSSLKVVVPSYVGIIPFIFMSVNGEWRISHILRLSSSVNEMFAEYSSTTANRKDDFTGDGNVQVYPSDLPTFDTRVAVPVEVFFSSLSYMNTYMQNIWYGYSNKREISEYFFAQLYSSFHTFIQALRVNEIHGDDPQMRDCGVKVGGYFIPYSKDLVFSSSRSPKKTVSAMWIGKGFEVDNTIALFDKKLISLYSGKSVNVSSYSTVQMRHGVIVGFSGGRYVQLQ